MRRDKPAGQSDWEVTVEVEPLPLFALRCELLAMCICCPQGERAHCDEARSLPACNDRAFV